MTHTLRKVLILVASGFALLSIGFISGTMSADPQLNAEIARDASKYFLSNYHIHISKMNISI